MAFVTLQPTTPGTTDTGHTNISGTALAGSIAVGTQNPDAAAAMDIVSTAKGFLPPRMTVTQRDAIALPPAGLSIYVTDTKTLNFYDGTRWRSIGNLNIRVEDYKAAADGKANELASIASGMATLTVDSSGGDQFSSSDVGKTVWVFRAGAAGATLKTTIQVVLTSTSATLAASASASVTKTRIFWGTDNTTAINNAFNDSAGRVGSAVEFSIGAYCVDGALTYAGPSGQNFIIKGQGPAATRIYQASTTANTFVIANSGIGQTISGFAVYGPGTASTAGAAVNWTGGGPTFFSRVEQLDIHEVWQGINWSGANNGKTLITDTDITNTVDTSVLVNGDGIQYKRGLIQAETPQTGAVLSISLGSPNLAASVNTFTTKDIGKKVIVTGAGASGADLVSTITAFGSETSVTLADSAGTTVSNVVGRLAFNTPYGIRFLKAGASYMDTVDIVGQNVSLQIDPSGFNQVLFGFFHNVLCDSAYEVGLNVAPNGGSVTSLVFDNCWFASAGTAIGGGTNRVGAKLTPAAGGTVKNVKFVGCRFIQNGKQGFYADQAGSSLQGVDVQDCFFDSNSASSSGACDGAFVGNVTDFVFTGNTTNNNTAGTGNVNNGLTLSSTTVGNIIIANNSFKNFIGVAVANGSPSTTQIISGNLPYAANAGLVAATVTQAGAYTVKVQDGTVLADASSGAVTVTLPPVASTAGLIKTVKKTDGTSNAVTIRANGTETIDGLITRPLSA